MKNVNNPSQPAVKPGAEGQQSNNSNTINRVESERLSFYVDENNTVTDEIISSVEDDIADSIEEEADTPKSAQRKSSCQPWLNKLYIGKPILPLDKFPMPPNLNIGAITSPWFSFPYFQKSKSCTDPYVTRDSLDARPNSREPSPESSIPSLCSVPARSITANSSNEGGPLPSEKSSDVEKDEVLPDSRYAKLFNFYFHLTGGMLEKNSSRKSSKVGPELKSSKYNSNDDETERANHFEVLQKISEEVFNSDAYDSDDSLSDQRKMNIYPNMNKSSSHSNEIFYPWTGEGHVSGHSMTFFCVVLGTRGDVQPLIMMSKRLMKDGHKIRIACHEAHRDSVLSQGVSWWPLEGWPPDELIAAPLDGRMSSLVPLLKQRNKYYGWYRSLYRSCAVAMKADWEDGSPFVPNAMIAHHAVFCALDLAESKRLPLFVYAGFPILPTSQFRHPFGIVMEGHVHGNKFSNKASFALQEAAYEMGLLNMQRECRKFLGLPITRPGSRTMSGRRLAKMRVPFLGLWSENLMSNPKNYHENHVVCGHIEQSGGLGELPCDVLKYLECGEPPLFFGFGSMTNETVLSLVWKTVVQACKDLNISRAVFHVNQFGMQCVAKYKPPNGILVLNKPVPHSVLFAQCSGIVHHGGSGTTHAGYFAGVPSCIVSFVIDQPWWGDILLQKNIGAHCRAPTITVNKLKECLLRLRNTDVIDNAKRFGEKMASEPNSLDRIANVIYSRMPAGLVDYRSLEKQSAWRNLNHNNKKKHRRTDDGGGEHSPKSV